MTLYVYYSTNLDKIRVVTEAKRGDTMSIDRTKYLFIGVDLHKHSHTAVLCNCFGDKIQTFKVQNTPLQFPLFLDKLNKFTDGKGVIFGLEDCNFYGRAFAKFLIKKGYMVKEVNSSSTRKRGKRVQIKIKQMR